MPLCCTLFVLDLSGSRRRCLCWALQFNSMRSSHWQQKRPLQTLLREQRFTATQQRRCFTRVTIAVASLLKCFLGRPERSRTISARCMVTEEKESRDAQPQIEPPGQGLPCAADHHMPVPELDEASLRGEQAYPCENRCASLRKPVAASQGDAQPGILLWQTYAIQCCNQHAHGQGAFQTGTHGAARTWQCAAS